MRQLITFILISLFAAISVYGQGVSEVTVGGIVIDASDEPIPNASVTLNDTTNAETIMGTVTDADGSFTLSIEPGSYLLAVSYVSNQPFEEIIELTAGQDYQAGIIQLEQRLEELGEVEVRAERSTMEMNFDSRTFNVGQDIVSMGGSALDVLDNIPSITTDFEGNVSLRGNQGVQVLINGRPSSLVQNGTEALSTIPSSMIENVEIITNPSSRYSAEGTAGIINIELRDNTNLGFNGSVSGNTGYPHNHEIGVNLNYHINNINWFLSTNLEYSSRPRSGNRYQLFSSPDTTYIYDQFSESQDFEYEGDLRFGADVYLPAGQLLTFNTRIDMEREDDEESVLYTDYLIDEFIEQRLSQEGPASRLYPDNSFQQVTREDFEFARESNLDFTLQYENIFNDDDDHKLTADFDFDIEREWEDSDLVERVMEGSDEPLNERTRNRENSRDLRIDLDYERPLGENGRFEAGFRGSFDWMENDYLAEREEGGTWVELPEFNENFRYHENVNALYSTVAGGVGSFSYQFGVRAEQTIIETELTQTNDVNRQNYLNLFPSVFISYEINDENSLQVSYSRRLRRPWSRMLLPFASYSDSRNQSSGNPELMPEFGNSYEAGYLRYWEGGSILTSLYYRYRTDVFERITVEGNDGVRRRFPINLATEKAWGVEFTADQDLFNNLQLLGSLNLYQSESEGVYEGERLSSEGGSFTSRLRIRWRFAEGWNFQSSIMYRGARQTTQGRRAGTSFVNFGLAKELLDRRATISLSVRDLFNARSHDEIINDANSYSVNDFSWSSRSARLIFRYNFGTSNRGGRGR